MTESSRLMMVVSPAINPTNLSAAAYGTVTIPNASRGMALRRFPPLMDAKRRPQTLDASFNTRKKILFAFPRPRLMSKPECPPFNPVTFRRNEMDSAGTGTSVKLNSMQASSPPAQPTYNSPSSSESMLIRMSPFSIPDFRPLAPSIPVSSVAVNNASTGPCERSFDARTAIAAATPIPLSAPSVVPLAFTHSPSMMVSIGSLAKS